MNGDPIGSRADRPSAMPTIDTDGKVTEALCIHSKGRIVYISEMSAKWMGAGSPEELIGRAIVDVVSADQVSAMRNANLSLRNPGDRSPKMRSVVRRLDGSTSDCEVVVTRIEWAGAAAFQVEIYEIAPQVAAASALEHQVAMIANANDALIATTFNGVITCWNPAAERLFQRPTVDAIGTHISAATTPELDPRRIVPNGGVEHLMINRTDGVFAIRVSVSTMHNGYVLVCADHTALRRAEQRLSTIMESLDGGFLLVGEQGMVESANPAAMRLLGTDPRWRNWDDLYAETLGTMVDGSGESLAADPTLDTRLNGTPLRDLVVGYDREPGDRVWMSLHCRRLLPDDPSVLVTLIDFTEHQLVRDQLTYAATHDHLTGLYNRARVTRLMTDAVAGPKTAIRAALFIDLDNLKSINDTMGHSAGDLVLKISAKRLTACVPADAVVGRVGGDEFVCLVRASSDDELYAVCTRIHTMLGQPVDFNGTELPIGASIGVRVFHASETHDPATILADADRAMYQAKSAGRNQIRIFPRRVPGE